MTNYTDRLWKDLVREHGPSFAQADSQQQTRVGFLGRTRLLAGSTLGVAAIGAAVVVALGAAGTTPAYAVTATGANSVLVTLNQDSALPQANAKLSSMGIGEKISITMASGAATVSGPVTCTPGAGVSGPTVKVLNGNDGTYVVASGNTGAGTWHLVACTTQSTADGGSGNTGA